MSAARGESRQTVVWSALIVVLVAAAAGLYYWLAFEREDAPPEPSPPAVQAPPGPEAPAEPQIRHPIEQARPEPAPETPPLPALAESDIPIAEAVSGLIGKEAFEKYFYPKELARRFVVTVDNLPRKKLPQRYGLAKPVAGKFLTSGAAESIAISPNNYRRYAPYVRLAEAVDSKRLVALYVYFYPLLQEEYQNLGYPNRYFNDRLIQAIDDLLAAPEPKGPVALVQPKVVYEFADPELEGRSAGQKILIRMGAENAARIKAKLKEIRAALASGG